jgi:mono/diheme cytochrome c family protein
MRDAVAPLIADPDAGVRRQLAFTLGAGLPETETTLLAMLQRDARTPFVADAALTGLAGREAAILDRVVLGNGWPAVPELVAALATAVANEGLADRVDRLIRLSANGEKPTWVRAAILEGMDASGRKTFPYSLASTKLLRQIDHPELADKAQAIARRFEPQPEPARAAPAATVSAEILEQGRLAYAICGACHQADGSGFKALAPALRGAPRVIGPPEVLIDIVLNGRDEDPAYPSMPPLAGMPDDQIAAILTYIRQAWGHAAAPVTPDQVRERRNGRE